MKRRRSFSFWLGIVLIVFAAVLLSYAVWAAVGNLILVPQFAEALGLAVVPTGWFWLVFQVALPFVLATLALLMTRSQPLFLRGLVLLTAAAVFSAISIDIMHSIPPSRFFG